MTARTRGTRRGSGKWVRYAGVAVVAVVLLASLGVLPQRARAASYACTEAGLDSAIATGGSATFACGSATTVTITGTKTIATFVSLDGGGLLTISGGNARRVFIVNSGITFAVQNLTLSNGNASSISSGGGNGGGILNNGGAVTVTNSTLSSNFTNQSGGGIYNNAGSVAITGSLLDGNYLNSDTSGGGGLYNLNGTVAVANSTFSNNYAGYGGAIDVSGGTATVVNSTLSSNTAVFTAGGINNAGTLNLTDSLVVNNTETTVGSSDLSGTAPSVNSHNRTGAFIFADGSTTTPGNHGGPTATFALPLNSPAIDAGVCNPTYTNPITTRTVTVTTDQRGISRPQGNGCDIGAFESQGASVRVAAGNGQTATVTTAFAVPLRVTATALDPGVSASGASLTFIALASGASGTFASIPPGATSVTVTVDTNGNATAPTFTANTVAGSYTVIAGSANGAGGAATFTLANTAAAAASISVVSGDHQTAQVGSAFAPLTVLVKDAHNNPVSGVPVVFAAPAGNVPSITFGNGGSLAFTDDSGYASITATAAGRPGVFSVPATINGVSTSFTLTNTANPASTVTLTGFSPPTGPTSGGNSITLTGTNLTGASSVSIVGGGNATITANTATALTVTAPPHAAGTVDISVTVGSQTATIHGYTYVDTGVIAVQPGLHPLPGSGSGGEGGILAPAPARHADAGGSGAQPQAAPAGGTTATAPATPNAQPGRH